MNINIKPTIPMEVLNPFLPTITIAWMNNNHYELLLPLNLNNIEYPIEQVVTLLSEHNKKLFDKLNNAKEKNRIIIRKIQT